MSAGTVETISETCAQTAQRVRRELKAQYRGVKFSVRSKTYSGGASIDVGWTDGPAERDVWTFVQKFSGATFDGMTDMKSYKDETLFANPDGSFVTIRSGADFVFANRSISQTWTDEVAAEIERVSGEPCDLSRRGSGWNNRYAVTVHEDRIVSYMGVEYGQDIFRQATRKAQA